VQRVQDHERGDERFRLRRIEPAGDERDVETDRHGPGVRCDRRRGACEQGEDERGNEQ
jgi:hypothetical protein